MLNIVIPMAGRGSRFTKEGYKLPKPLIPVHGKPMIEVVINNLKPSRDHRFIFICLAEHLQNYQLDHVLKGCASNCEIIPIDIVTEGAACTVLLAKQFIDSDEPLMIANCDQWVDIDINDYLEIMDKKQLDGLIMTMTADDPKWSFVRLDKSGFVCEVVEKQVVSQEATVGIYNYQKGSDFVQSARSMINTNLRVNNEFYVAPAYDEMIAQRKIISFYNIGKDGQGMYGLGTPHDLKQFLETQPPQRFLQGNLSKSI